ncbi:MAG: HEAT repeat domain-containing protein [Acidobacteriota bacterium]
MNCESVKNQAVLFLYGELSLEQEQSFQDHLEQCPACREAFEAEKRLHELLDAREIEPDAALLTRCRRDLARRIESAAPPKAPVRNWLERFFDLRLAALARPLGALALVALGFFAARWTSGPAPLPKVSGRFEPVVTRVRYLDPEPSGQVRLLVEETRQRTLSGSAGDEQIRRLLLAAARESSDPGVRAESMDVLNDGRPTAELRPVLLYALQHDSNPGVRLKALDALKNESGDRDVRRVLSQVLLTDDNPGVRAQAIDLLVQHKEDATVGVLQKLVQEEKNNYVRLRCQRALEEMNASVGTF